MKAPSACRPGWRAPYIRRLSSFTPAGCVLTTAKRCARCQQRSRRSGFRHIAPAIANFDFDIHPGNKTPATRSVFERTRRSGSEWCTFVGIYLESRIRIGRQLGIAAPIRPIPPRRLLHCCSVHSRAARIDLSVWLPYNIFKYTRNHVYLRDMATARNR